MWHVFPGSCSSERSKLSIFLFKLNNLRVKITVQELFNLFLFVDLSILENYDVEYNFN